MASDSSVENRTAEFARSETLETLMGVLSDDLAEAEASAMTRYYGQQPKFPPIFVMGAPRCGSTLFMQWLASTGAFAYPTNLLSRFWRAPITGARIQKMLTDPDYDFRNELDDLKSGIDFDSHNGKTTGALSPNEFWYFWRRFMPGDKYCPREELESILDSQTLCAEIAGMTDLFGKSFATKGMIFNENIPLFSDLFPNAIFVSIRRQPEYNIQSLLLARERQYGDMRQWYSFKIRNHPALATLPPVESVGGQVAAIDHAIEKGLQSLPADRQLVIDYKDFCADPARTYSRLNECVKSVSGASLAEYKGLSMFNAREDWRLDWVDQAEVRKLYQRALSREYGTNRNRNVE